MNIHNILVFFESSYYYLTHIRYGGIFIIPIRGIGVNMGCCCEEKKTYRNEEEKKANYVYYLSPKDIVVKFFEDGYTRGNCKTLIA